MRIRKSCFVAAAIAMTAAIIMTGCPGGGETLPRPTDVTVTPGVSTVVAGTGAVLDFAAEVDGPDGVSQDVAWTHSVVPAGAQGVIFTSATAQLSVLPTVPVGTVITVRATAVGHPGVFGEATVTVVSEIPPSPTDVILYPPNVEFEAGEVSSRGFTAEVDGPAGVSQDVVWSFIPAETPGVELTQEGSLTISAEVPAWTVITVIATAYGYDEVHGKAIVTMIPNVVVGPQDGADATVRAGESLPFAATSAPDGALYGVDVTWEARNADGDYRPEAISVTGAFSVPADASLGGLGTWSVRATTVVAPEATIAVSSDWVNVEVTAAMVASVSAVTPATANIQLAFAQAQASQQFQATTLPALAPNDITWSVYPQPTGVNIDQTGYLTVANTVTVTSLTVTATATGTAFSSTANVTVVPKAGAGFTIEFATLVDRAPGEGDIYGPNISLLTGGTITVSYPEGDISWYFAGRSVNTDFPGSVSQNAAAAVLNLSSAVLAEIIGPQLGSHFVTVVVERGGMEYSRRISITVTE